MKLIIEYYIEFDSHTLTQYSCCYTKHMTNLHSILCWVHMEANFDTFQYPTCVSMLKLKRFEKRIASTHKAVKNEARICFIMNPVDIFRPHDMVIYLNGFEQI